MPSRNFIFLNIEKTLYTNGLQNLFNKKGFFENAGGAFMSGGMSGMASYNIGQQAAAMGGFGQVAYQTGAHALLGGVSSASSGGSFWAGFASGGASSIAATGVGALTAGASPGLQGFATFVSGALAGGFSSSISGGDFWQGFGIGAISAGLNHVAHSLQSPAEIMVLQDSEGAYGGGHMAILIEEKNGSYRYLSKDGRAPDNEGGQEGTISSGGNSAISNTRYGSKSAALQANSRYELSITFRTSFSKAARSIAASLADANTTYNVFIANCGHTVAAGLRAANLYGGSNWIPNNRYQEIFYYQQTGKIYTFNRRF